MLGRITRARTQQLSEGRWVALVTLTNLVGEDVELLYALDPGYDPRTDMGAEAADEILESLNWEVEV